MLCLPLNFCLHPLVTSAYMVFHAEGLAGNELHYAAQLTVRPVRGFENSGHHFPAAESVLPADDKPPADVPSPSYVAFPIAAAFLQGDSIVVHESGTAPTRNMLQ